MQVEELFEEVSRRLLEQHPEDQRGRMLHSPGLKTAGKFFAFAPKGELIVKLPAARVRELVSNGDGRPCDPGRGRPMKEWVRVTPVDEQTCAAYLVEARSFVATLT